MNNLELEPTRKIPSKITHTVYQNIIWLLCFMPVWLLQWQTSSRPDQLAECLLQTRHKCGVWHTHLLQQRSRSCKYFILMINNHNLWEFHFWQSLRWSENMCVQQPFKLQIYTSCLKQKSNKRFQALAQTISNTLL